MFQNCYHICHMTHSKTEYDIVTDEVRLHTAR